MKKLHSIEKWYGTGLNLLNEFTNSEYQTLGSFKVPASLSKYFNDTATQDDVVKVITRIGNIYIDALLNTPKARKLRYLPWTWLEPKDKEYLKDGLIKALEHAVRNHQVWERINNMNITTPNFTLSQDQTAWVLSGDVFGMFASNSITNAEIDLYEVVGSEYFYEQPNGNIKIIGRITDTTLKSLPELTTEVI